MVATQDTQAQSINRSRYNQFKLTQAMKKTRDILEKRKKALFISSKTRASRSKDYDLAVEMCRQIEEMAYANASIDSSDDILVYLRKQLIKVLQYNGSRDLLMLVTKLMFDALGFKIDPEFRRVMKLNTFWGAADEWLRGKFTNRWRLLVYTGPTVGFSTIGLTGVLPLFSAPALPIFIAVSIFMITLLELGILAEFLESLPDLDFVTRKQIRRNLESMMENTSEPENKDIAGCILSLRVAAAGAVFKYKDELENRMERGEDLSNTELAMYSIFKKPRKSRHADIADPITPPTIGFRTYNWFS